MSHSFVRRAAVAVVTAAGLAFVSPAAAEAQKPTRIADQTEAPDPLEVAKQRYQAGVKEFAAGRYKDAVDLFLEADQLAPSAALSFNIARAYVELGDRAASLKWFRDYLRRAPDAPDAKDVQKQVDALEAQLMAKGVQQVTILSEPHGATVVIDGHPMGVTPWTGELPPGEHVAALHLRGYAEVQQSFTLPPADAIDVNFRLVPERKKPASAPAEEAEARPAAAPPPDRAAEGSSPVLGILGWTALGVGVASLGAAVTFEVLRSQAEEDARNEPTQIGFVDAVDTMESRQTMARVFAGAGAVLVLTGGALLAIDGGLFSSGPDTTVSFGCGPLGCAAGARGRF
jgi:tetratricopeptide (TPR) repeat protein